MYEVVLPKLTHDMVEARLVAWLKAEGDLIEPGDPLYEVETDKATAEVEAEFPGILAGVSAQPGDLVPVGARLAYLLAAGEVLPEIEETEQAAVEEWSAARPVSPLETSAPRQEEDSADPSTGRRIVATPIARRLAAEHGIPLAQVNGSGPRGRIIQRDIEALVAALESAGKELQPVATGLDTYTVVPLTAIQQKTGKRMLQSMRQAPYFDLELEVDMSGAAGLRAQADRNISYTAILLGAAAQALAAVPSLNAHFVEGELRVFEQINLGVAMTTARGLLVPVIHNAERLDLGGIQDALDRLRARAKIGRFRLDELRGSTFTVSNLGMFGVDNFRAILNPPEVSILAAGRILEKPIVQHGRVLVRPMMRVTLTVDHRALDGASAAPFLGRFAEILEAL